MIEVLFTGAHEVHDSGPFYDLGPLTSSVTLIRDGGLNMLVDSGSLKFFPVLKKRLEDFGLKPADIHHIFNTHYHMDHCSNDVFFKNAKVWIGRSILNYKTGRVRIYRDISKVEYPNCIRLILSPGHTPEHFSYLHEEKGKKYVCAGDAIREDIIRKKAQLTALNPEQFVESMKGIFEMADVIIPGHGRVIHGDLKNELKALAAEF